MKKNSFTLVFFLIPFFCLACSCGGPSSFCVVINLEINEHLIVLSGKKLRDVSHGMEVEVLQVFRGEESRSKIMVWGDNGFLCRRFTSGFEIGSELILALSKREWAGSLNSGTEEEEAGDYILSSCGLRFMRCNDLTNPFTGEEEDISDCLGNNFCSCEGSYRFDFYPNPTQGIIHAKMKKEEESNNEILVYNISGQVVRKYYSDDLFVNENLLEID